MPTASALVGTASAVVGTAIGCAPNDVGCAHKVACCDGDADSSASSCTMVALRDMVSMLMPLVREVTAISSATVGGTVRDVDAISKATVREVDPMSQATVREVAPISHAAVRDVASVSRLCTTRELGPFTVNIHRAIHNTHKNIGSP